MKRIFCPKCDNQMAFDETRYPEGKKLAFVCTQCGHQFSMRTGRKLVRNKDGEMKEVKEADFSKGYISVIENAFGYKQDFPLTEGDNIIGRRNKDTHGVDVPIITTDPSMARKHCVINVKSDAEGGLRYTLRDFPSLTGTFLSNELVGKNERVIIEDGAIVTTGATTFILHTNNKD
ncbi:MAG: FHA domain-containing protein [Tannerellaceae bacterium]|jgi:DNA-directed RNA polymerase subunit M/transcription elongation factor TFIIS|nr:FHA domain-containing protein [Tannerellaceae bacterium]